MTDTYWLNPFAIVSESDGGFLLCGSNRLQVRFEKKQQQFIDLLVSGRPLSRNDLRRYVADNRIEEMRRKHILLKDRVPPLTGRYSRQFGFFSLISEDYESYHNKLAQADVLLLGAGAIGSHVLWHLAAMGVKKVTVVDFDIVEDTNLNRQLMYAPEDVGQPKVEVLCGKIAKFNPGIEVNAVSQRICGSADVERFLPGRTLVVKAIDTPEQSTEWVNEVCVKHSVPFITGGFIDDVGVVGPAYIPGKSVCVACFQPDRLKRIHGTGPTFAPLTGMISSMISMCVFRMITGTDASITNKLYTYSTFSDTWETIPLATVRPCKVCGREPEKQAPPARGGVSGVWGYRAAIVLLMILVGLLRSITHDQYIGLLMLSVLFLSMPALDLICGKKPEETRREIFIISCIYSLVSLLIVFLQGNLTTVSWPKGWSFDAAFGVIEQMSHTIIEAAVAITCLFFSLILFMHGLKTVTKEREKWIS